MKVNQPITPREFTFAASETLGSTNNLQGRLRYCNASFVSFSGFSGLSGLSAMNCRASRAT